MQIYCRANETNRKLNNNQINELHLLLSFSLIQWFINTYLVFLIQTQYQTENQIQTKKNE